MTSVVDMDLVEVENTESSEWLRLVFEVVFPGEICCRSEVLVGPGLFDATALDSPVEAGRLASSARDSLLEFLEANYGAVSVKMQLSSEGRQVLAAARPGRTRH